MKKLKIKIGNLKDMCPYTYEFECRLYTGSAMKKLLIIVSNINNKTGNIWKNVVYPFAC
jgi:hypothetical protein